MWFTQAVVSSWHKGSLSSKQDDHLIFKHSNTYFAVLLLAFCLLKSMLFFSSSKIVLSSHWTFRRKKDSSHPRSCQFHLLSLTFIWYDRLVIKLKNQVPSVLYPPSSFARGDETRRWEKNKERRGEEISSRSQTITIKMKILRKILVRVWRPAFLESLCLVPPPPYWLLCPPCSSIISHSALFSWCSPCPWQLFCDCSGLLGYLQATSVPLLSFSSILVTPPCPPLLPTTTCVIFLASVAFPMSPPFRFSLRFLCPFWLSQLSLELRKPQKVQRLISVWISVQTLDILHQFFTESLWI